MVKLVGLAFRRFLLAIDDRSVRVVELPLTFDANDASGLHLELEMDDPLAEIDALEGRTNERCEIQSSRDAVHCRK